MPRLPAQDDPEVSGCDGAPVRVGADRSAASLRHSAADTCVNHCGTFSTGMASLLSCQSSAQ